MANRLAQEDSDARLEELFGEEPAEEPLPAVKSWEEGAEEVAKMIGAQVGVLQRFAFAGKGGCLTRTACQVAEVAPSSDYLRHAPLVTEL